MIDKVTPRSRNSAVDKRYVSPDQYTDAVNIRVENSFSEAGDNASGNVGVVKPVIGNRKVISNGVALENFVVVGSVLDVPTNTLYFAAASTSNATLNGVFMVNPQTEEIDTILQTSYFAWDGVSNVDMAIARNRDDNVILYMTDNVNDPYKVDVQFALNNSSISGERLYDSITVCPETPVQPPVAGFSYTPGKVSNFKSVPGVQFAYQNIYETSEISALSSYSGLVVPPAYLGQGAGTLDALDSYNTITVTIPAQNTSVETVRLLVRFGETGSWFMIDEYPHTGSDIQAEFSNDEVLSQIPEKESNRLFDAVPLRAATNEIQEDRLFYGNYSEGRYNTLTENSNFQTGAALSVIYADRPDDFNPVSLEIEPQVVTVNRENSEGSHADNRIAGFSIQLGNDPTEIVPAASTVVFDFTCAPDKNFHIYESAHSFHANNELYNFDAGESNHIFQNNFNYNALSHQAPGGNLAYNRWPASTWGFAQEAPLVGIGDAEPDVYRYGVSDDVMTSQSARWEVKAGPLKGEMIDCVFGCTPSTPLILRGGDISFSVKFQLTTDLSISQVVEIIVNILDEKPNPGSIVIGESSIEVATIIDSNTRGGYSINMGVPTQGHKRFERTDDIVDVITAVGDRAYAKSELSFNGQTSTLPSAGEPLSAVPLGYFVVNKADVQFKLRDVTPITPYSLTDQGTKFYVALDITDINDVEVATMIPIFESSYPRPFTNDDPRQYWYQGQQSGNATYQEYEGGTFYGQGTSITAGFTLHHGSVVNGWVGVGRQASLSFSNTSTEGLFSVINGPSSSLAYSYWFDYQNQDPSIKEQIDAFVAENPITRNKSCWFGRLQFAGAGTGNGSSSSIGLQDADGNTFVNPGIFYRTYENALNLALNSGDLTTAPTAQTFANYACSMVDGEGGIGGWKGNIVDTAKRIAPYMSTQAVQDNDWDVGYAFSDEQLNSAFSRFKGKLDGSCPASLIHQGRVVTSQRHIVDDRTSQGWSNLQSYDGTYGFYPAGAPDFGPAIIGLYFPFQYLYTGGLDIDGPNDVGPKRFLGRDLSSYPYGSLDFEIINDYSLINDQDLQQGNVSLEAGNAPGYLRINLSTGDFDEQPSSVEILNDNTFILSASENTAAFKSFKRYSQHNIGIVYYDYFGRPGGVIPFDPVYVSGYSDAELPADSIGQGSTSIGVQFTTSGVPDWAHSYRFVYGGNTSVDRFIQYTAGGAFIASNEDPNAPNEANTGNIYVSLNYLQENLDVSYARSFGAVSDIGDKNLYKFSGGDKLRILSYFNGDALESREFPVNYTFDVVDVVTLTGDPTGNPLHNVEDGDQVPKSKQGQFVVVKNNPAAGPFTWAAVRNAGNDATTVAHKWNNRTVIEIYKPKAEREDTELIWREIGPSYKIVEAPAPYATNAALVRTHEYNGHVLTDGDVWFRRIAMNMPKYQDGEFKNIIRDNNSSYPRFFDYYVESQRFTDMIAGSEVQGKGKAALYVPDSKTLTKSSTVSFSDVNSRSSKYNRLSTFDATTANFKEIPNDHGSIQIMIKDGDSLAVFQQSKLSMLPINRSILSDASNSASLIASSKVVGNQVFIPGSFGVGNNPESVLYVDGVMYFANPLRREVYRYKPGGGVETISDSGMQDYFYDLFSNTGDSWKVLSAFDYKNDEYIIDYSDGFEPINYSVPPTFPSVEVLDAWPGSQPIDPGARGVAPGKGLTPPPTAPSVGVDLSGSSQIKMNETVSIADLPRKIRARLENFIKKKLPSFSRRGNFEPKVSSKARKEYDRITNLKR